MMLSNQYDTVSWESHITVITDLGYDLLPSQHEAISHTTADF